MNRIPQGLGVALATPFQAGKIDISGLHKLVDHVVSGGADYLVCLGSTGEAALLDQHEQHLVLRKTMAFTGGRIPVIAGNFGGNHTAALCRKLQDFDLHGAIAVLSSAPEYVKPSQAGLLAHYRKVADASPLPVILYDVPSRTACHLHADTTCALAEHENIVAIKDATGNMAHCASLIRNTPDDFQVISGDDPTALHLVNSGGDGVISVLGNAFPGLFSQMIHHALRGHCAKARAIHLALTPLLANLNVEGNPVGIKSALEILGICRNEVRLPLVPMRDTGYQVLEREINKLLALDPGVQ